MSEPIGTRVNLRQMLTSEGLKAIKKGDYLNFKDNETGEITCIKVIRAGFLRYEGEIIVKPKTEAEILAENSKVEQELADEVSKMAPVQDVTDQVEIIKPPKKATNGGSSTASPKRIRKNGEGSANGDSVAGRKK